MSLRLRLTLLTTMLVGLTLTGLGVGLYYAMQQAQYDHVNNDLHEYTGLVINDLNRRQVFQAFGISQLEVASDGQLDTSQIYGQGFDLQGTPRLRSPNVDPNK